jgi:hypothetical protein
MRRWLAQRIGLTRLRWEVGDLNATVARLESWLAQRDTQILHLRTWLATSNSARDEAHAGRKAAERDVSSEIQPGMLEERLAVTEGYGPGSFGCHEALHAVSIAVDLVSRSVVEHPAIDHVPDWKARAEQALEQLWELYLEIGKAHLS